MPGLGTIELITLMGVGVSVLLFLTTLIFAILAYVHSHNRFSLDLFSKRTSAVGRIASMHQTQVLIMRTISGSFEDIGLKMPPKQVQEFLQENIAILREKMRELSELYIHEYDILFSPKTQKLLNNYIVSSAQLPPHSNKALQMARAGNNLPIENRKQVSEIQKELIRQHISIENEMLAYMYIGQYKHISLKDLPHIIVNNIKDFFLLAIKWPFKKLNKLFNYILYWAQC